jgi:TolB-like protein/Flp pilus assembly protein TadD
MVITAGLVLGGVFWFLMHSRKPVTAINSVAVLPFVNVSSDQNIEYLSDGMTESLINSLSQVPNLKVIGRSSAFRYKNRQVDPHSVGQELTVQAILSGQIIEHNGDVTITVDLEDARDRSHIWGEQYNRKMTDILGLQNEISRIVTEKLRVRLNGEDEKRLTKNYTENFEAYQLYLKGRWLWNKRTPDSKKEAIKNFQQAISVDPNFALAWAGLADALVLDGSVPLRDSCERARTAASRALVLDNTLGEAHATMGFIKSHYEHDWVGAEAEFQRAIQLNPNYATAHHWYADHFLARGQFENARSELEKAQVLDPLSPIINTDIGLVYFYQRDYDRAIDYLKGVAERFPDFFAVHESLAWAYTQKRMYDQAFVEYQQATTLSKGHTLVIAMTGYTYAVAGKKAEAEKILTDLQSRSTLEYIPPLRFALLQVGLGHNDQALHWIQKAQDELDLYLIYLPINPFFDPLRNEPKFKVLVANLGLASH